MKRISLFAFWSLAVFSACAPSSGKKALFESMAATRVDSLPGSCPYLTRDAQGHVVLSWVRSTGDSAAVFCYAVSPDNGKTFGTPVVIPSSTNVHPHAENLPKVVFKPDGEIIALWGAANPNPKNKYAGLVFYSQSFDGGKTWSQARTLVKDPSATDQRYFDVKLLPGGEAAISWLDARKTTDHQGSALYFATTQGKSGFGEGHLIEQPCCECCRTNLAIDESQNIHVVYRAIIQDSIRDMVYAVSHDGGKSFSAPQRISADNWVLNSCPHSGPSMTTQNGKVQVAWFTGGRESGIFYAQLDQNKNNFTAKDTVSRKGRHPQITTIKDGTTLITWEEPLVAGSKVYSRIGMETRNKSGQVLSRDFVTPDSVQASYPVLQPLTDGSVILAYTVSTGTASYIAFQKIHLTTPAEPAQRIVMQVPSSDNPTAKLFAITNTKDPSCSMHLPKAVADTLHWQGKVIGFCSPACRESFLMHPMAIALK